MNTQANNDGKDNGSAVTTPLVSVICRTMGRKELLLALESINRQTYPCLEIILVNAAGKKITALKNFSSPIPLTIVDNNEQLSRSFAANEGLDKAAGKYLLFLDEDDWIDPEHIELLVSSLKNHHGFRAAYSNIQKTTLSGEPTKEIFSKAWDPIALRHDNIFPIHAAIFERSLLEHGCQFDSSLDIFEDWDFWLQLSLHTDFIHLDKITGYYRQGGASNTAATDSDIRFRKNHPIALAREKVLNKWSSGWSGRQINEILGSLDRSAELKSLNLDLHRSHDQTRDAERKLVDLNSELEESQSLVQKVQGELEDSDREIQRKESDIQEKISEIQQRDSEIQRKESDIQEKMSEIQQTNTALEQKKAELNEHRESILELKNTRHHLQLHIKQLEASVEELLNSFSWKITKPYRWARHRTNQFIINPFLGRFSPAIGSGKLLVKRVSKKISTPAVDTIKCVLDCPNQQKQEFEEQLLIQGWAISNFELVEIHASIDDQLCATFIPNIPRPDVEELFPDKKTISNCGFFEKIPLTHITPGHHSLTLTIIDKAGATHSEEYPFYVFAKNQLYNHWLRGKSLTTHTEPANSDLPRNPSWVNVILTVPHCNDALKNSLRSLRKQTHKQWTCHFVAADKSNSAQRIRSYLDLNVESQDDNKKYHFHEELEPLLQQLAATDSLFTSLEPGVQLFPAALSEMVLPFSDYQFRDNVSTHKQISLVYCDHDSVDTNDFHSMPEFTFGWSPDHLLCRDYVGGFYLARTSLIKRTNFDVNSPAWRYGVLLDLVHTADEIIRIAKILWSQPLKSQLQKEQLSKAEICEVSRAIEGRGLKASVQEVATNIRYPNWHTESSPRVSIIIPTMGKLELVKPCMESLLNKTTYANFEIIILDNSRGQYPQGIEYLRSAGLQILDCPIAFNWAKLNNIGASHCEGELLLFLNDDIEIQQGNWLDELVKQAVRADVGAVGALLNYPDGAIQHAGVVLVDYGGGCSHLVHKMEPGAEVFQQLDKVVREVTANTGACLMVSREKFDALGGFDEKLAVVGNDVDLCLRLQGQGYRNLWTPHCRLIHHESISRKASVPKEDEQAMWTRWEKQFNHGDKYYNPNLSLQQLDGSLKLQGPVLIPELIDQLVPAIDVAKSPASPPAGVNLIGYIRAEMGLGEGARSDARALQAINEPFGIINFESGNPARMTDLSWQHKEVKSARFDINLMHINADFTSWVKAELPEEFFNNRYTIGYWAWELPEIPDQWVDSFYHVDEVWVPSTFAQQAVAMKSTVPVIVIPHCIELKVDDTITRADFKLPEERFLFISMFDPHSIPERKNPYAAIKAFKQAFSENNTDAALVLKVNNADTASMRELKSYIKPAKNIFLIDQVSTRREINALLSLTDCFVSLHRSEGFGLGPAESMSLGKATILTNWSGNTDYMTKYNCIAIDYELVSLKKDYGPYKANQKWAEPDIDQAADNMLKLVNDPGLAEQLGTQAKLTIQENFSPAAVGLRMQKRLAAIRKQRNR